MVTDMPRDTGAVQTQGNLQRWAGFRVRVHVRVHVHVHVSVSVYVHAHTRVNPQSEAGD